MRGLSKEGGDAEGIDVRGAKGSESVDGMRNGGGGFLLANRLRSLWEHRELP